MHPKKNLVQNLGAALQKIRSLGSVMWRWEAQFKGVLLDDTVLFVGRPILSVAPESEFRIGSGATFNSAERANPLACFQPCVLRTAAPGARLIIGSGVGISGAVVCAANSIEIGSDTIVGSGAMLLDTDFHQPGPGWTWVDSGSNGTRPIRIGRGVFVGTRAIVLKGVTIGDRCVVGAGAVVTKDVPAGSMAVGNPARIVPMHGLASQER